MKSILLSFIILMAIQCGDTTDQGMPVQYDYSIINSSGQQVTMFVYKNGVRDLSSKVILEPGEKLQKKYIDGAPYDGFSMTKIFNSEATGYVTDVEIIYNNHRKMVYHQCTDGFCTGTQKTVFGIEYNNEPTEVFTLTPDDYHSAVQCTGNCY